MTDIRDVIIVVLSELCMFFMRVILDNPINQAQETAPTNDTSNLAPSGSHGVKDTFTTTDMHDDQEFTSSIQVEMLMQPAKLELKMSKSLMCLLNKRPFLEDFVKQNMN